ncbi:CpsD/CapB family tyrosine-protein kinase [Sorangium sp. So ce1014]|uniref:CpsD/CapB family tyrosine-protein kinase n=1 Tax=Sorangium sp. So ce1014 TaxID=3133326 RepID=UPI003F5F16CF
MAEAGGAEPGKPPPVASLERALDQVCDFLSRAEQTARVRALVIEARRLRNVVGNWRSIAPDPDVREEMIARVLRLANDAEDVVAAERPSSSHEDPSAAFDSPTIRQDLPHMGHQPPHGMGLRLGAAPMPGGHPGMQAPIKGPPQAAAMFLAGLSGEHGDPRGAPQGHPAMHGAPAPALPPGPERHFAGPVVTRVVDLSATLSSPGLVSSGPGAASSPALPGPIDRVIAPPARDAGVRNAAGPPAGAPPLERAFSATFRSPPSLVFDRVVPREVTAREVTVREVPPPPRQQQQQPPPERPLERSGTAAFSSPPSLMFNRVVSTPAQQAVDAKLQSLDPTFEEPPSLHIEHMRSLPGAPESAGLLPAEPLGGPGEVTVRPLPLPDAVDANIVMIHAPYSPQADAYRTLRRKLPSGSGTTIAVTSAGPGEGKTSCAINLALALRETVRGKILLIEANIRKPGIAKALRFEPPSCFTEQLQRHASDRFAPWVVVDQAAPAPAVAPGDDGIDLSDRNAAPMGGRSPDPRLSVQTPVHILAVDPRTERPPILDSVAFSTAIESLKRAGYSYIVIDTPPVLGSMDMNVIGDSVDGVLLTSLVKKSTRKAIRQAIDQLRPAPILGVVLLDA